MIQIIDFKNKNNLSKSIREMADEQNKRKRKYLKRMTALNFKTFYGMVIKVFVYFLSSLVTSFAFFAF